MGMFPVKLNDSLVTPQITLNQGAINPLGSFLSSKLSSVWCWGVGSDPHFLQKMGAGLCRGYFVTFDGDKTTMCAISLLMLPCYQQLKRSTLLANTHAACVGSCTREPYTNQTNQQNNN